MNRQSNFELLRIVSIILVLIEHVNLVSTGVPTATDFEINPIITFIRVFTQCATMPAVGLFVMISGWFGIKSKVGSYFNLLFQVVFWYYSIAIIMLLLSHFNYIDYSLPLWKLAFPITQSNWFIINYLALMFLSPMLNKYIEVLDKRRLTITTAILMMANIYWGFIQKLPAFGNGYGFVFMICVYLVGRTLNLYYRESISKLSSALMGGVFLFLSTVNALFCTYWYVIKEQTEPYFYSYNNPLIVASIVSLFCVFANLKVESVMINKISKSVLAILLIHTHPYVKQMFVDFNNRLFQTNDFWGYIIQEFLFIVIIIIVALVIDRVRIYIYNKYSTKVITKVSKYAAISDIIKEG